MNKIKFSILIPNYGYSKYLSICLKSLLNQTDNGLFEYEIIMCDQSPNDIYIKLVEETNNLKLNNFKLLHSDIKGVFKARHTLLKNATGDYVVFVDSDDYVSPDYLSNLSTEIKKHSGPDILITSFVVCDENGAPLNKQPRLDIANSNNIKDYFIFTSNYNSVWRKIFRKTLYDFNDYQNTDFNVSNGDDWVISFPLMTKAKKIIISNNIKDYYYRGTPNSITHSLNTEAFEKALHYKDVFLKNISTNNFQKSIRLEDLITFYSSTTQSLIKKKDLNKQNFIRITNLIYEIIMSENLFCLEELTKKHKFIYKMIVKKKNIFLLFALKVFAKRL